MQQKVQFIATVIHEPELVILDEPFSGLDPVNAETLTRIIEELRASGRTVIFSTHVMEHAEKLCDSVFMICRGKKVLDGSVDEIRARYRQDVVDIDGEGDASVFGGVAGVRAARHHGGRVEVELEHGTDPQSLLDAARSRFRIHRFEVRSPRLHDIFVRIAGNELTDGVAVAAKGE
jgi:ABC-2 type transport system ATP-binding protein